VCDSIVGVSGGEDESQGPETWSNQSGMCGRWKVKQGTGSREQGVGMYLVRKPVRSVGLMEEVREGSTGAVVVMLPRVWAVAEEVIAPLAPEPTRDGEAVVDGAPALGVPEPLIPKTAVPAGSPAASVLKPEVAFYRKYTEAMLRRYLRLSMEAGRVPSLLGRELFRGHVTSYKVSSFEDVVIFCFDVEKCLGLLSQHELELIKRIALQEYSQTEAAAALGMNPRSCVIQYFRAIDRLTEAFLQARMLEGAKTCQ